MDRHNKLSVGLWSDGSGSPVEDEPLLEVTWAVVLDSQSELLGTDGFSIVDSLTSLHSRSDLETLSASKWVLGEVDSLCGDLPGLVCTVVA